MLDGRTQQNHNGHLTSNINSTEPNNTSTVYFIFLYSLLTLFLILSKVLFLKISLRTLLLLNIYWICYLLETFCQKVNASLMASVSSHVHSTLLDSIEDRGISGMLATKLAVLFSADFCGSWHGSALAPLPKRYLTRSITCLTCGWELTRPHKQMSHFISATTHFFLGSIPLLMSSAKILSSWSLCATEVLSEKPDLVEVAKLSLGECTSCGVHFSSPCWFGEGAGKLGCKSDLVGWMALVAWVCSSIRTDASAASFLRLSLKYHSLAIQSEWHMTLRKSCSSILIPILFFRLSSVTIHLRFHHKWSDSSTNGSLLKRGPVTFQEDLRVRRSVVCD